MVIKYKWLGIITNKSTFDEHLDMYAKSTKIRLKLLCASVCLY